MNILKNFLFSCWLCMSAGCQSWQKIEPSDLEAAHPKDFSRCNGGDGTQTVMVKDGDDLVLSAYLDWINHEDGGWSWEVGDSMGRILAGISFDPVTGLKLRGRLASFSSRVALDEAGYLLFDGHLTGLKASEGACLFLQTVPKSWLSLVVEKRSQEGADVYFFEDDKRTMMVTFPQDRPGDSGPVCMQTTQSLFWGLKSYENRWCWWPGQSKGSVTLNDQYHLEWQAIKDEL